MATNVAVLNFSGKGHSSPFPPFLRQYCLSLAGIARTSNRGLGSPHSADYTETLTPPIVHQDKRFTFGQNHAVIGPLGIFINRWSYPASTLAGEASPHAVGSTSATKRFLTTADKSNFTHRPYTIPGCTYAPISITPGVGLTYQKLFPLLAVPVRNPRAGAIHATFDLFI